MRKERSTRCANCLSFFRRLLLFRVLQGDRGEQWMQQFFPKKPFAESADGLTTIRRGQGPIEQVSCLAFPLSARSSYRLCKYRQFTQTTHAALKRGGVRA